MAEYKEHYLYTGTLFAHRDSYIVSTVLGSCVSTCLWDPVLRMGGINHYQLALWNGVGLASPKYGNIAIEKLIGKMLKLGCKKKNLVAKVFGGASVLDNNNSPFKVGEENTLIAQKVLSEIGIKIVAADVGGVHGRKLRYDTQSGVVIIKKIRS